MVNNSNPHDVDGNQIRNKSRNNDVVRATVIDVLPQSHAVRVNPRGDNAPIVAPVLTPMYGMHLLPQEKERVTLLYITENVPVVVGGVYLADGPNPPDAEEGEAVFGNSTGARLDMRPDGSIGMKTGELSDPIDIDFQVADTSMSTDQSVPPDTFTKIEFDQLDNQTEVIYDLQLVNDEAEKPVGLLMISNQHPTRISLDPRSQSRLNCKTLEFQSYTAPQLEEILQSRVRKGFRPGTVPSEVVEKIAEQVAEDSGDCRKALSLLLNAGRKADRKGNNELRVKDVL